MKRLALVSILLINGFLWGGLLAAQDVEFSWQVNCREEVNGQLHYWVGYTSSLALPDSYLAYIGNGPGIYLNRFEAGEQQRVIDVLLPEPDSAVTLFVYPEDVSITITAETSAPDCDAVEAAYGPDGGLQTITKAVAPGCYAWEIQDDYGHWSSVATTCSQAEGDQVFVRLVLGRDNAVTDPDRYRVWSVDE